jgi:hypothetical protein
MKNQHLLDVYKNNYQYIAGWFDIKFLEELLKLNQIHEKKNIKGNLLEIGVYESKSFIPLSFLLKSNEQIIGIDLFSPIEDLNNGICLNSLNRAEMNLKKIYRQNIKDLNYKLIKENSKNLKSNHYLGYVNNNLNLVRNSRFPYSRANSVSINNSFTSFPQRRVIPQQGQRLQNSSDYFLLKDETVIPNKIELLKRLF